MSSTRHGANAAMDRKLLVPMLNGLLSGKVDGLVFVPVDGRGALCAGSVDPEASGWIEHPIEIYGRPVGELRVHGGVPADHLRLLETLVCHLERGFELDDVIAELLCTYEELNFLWDLQAELGALVTGPEIASMVLTKTLSIIPCAGSALYVRQGLERQWGLLSSLGPGVAWPRKLDLSARGLVEGAVVAGRSLAVDDLQNAPSEGLATLAERSLVACPLRAEHQVTGVLVLLDRMAHGGRTRSGQGTFNSSDCKLLETVASQAATLLHNMELLDARKEIQCAQKIQRALLPTTAPQLQGLDVAFSCAMASIVGGDFIER